VRERHEQRGGWPKIGRRCGTDFPVEQRFTDLMTDKKIELMQWIAAVSS
jgi:hypothetical protein